MVYTDIVTFPRSTGVIKGQCHMSFFFGGGVVPPEVIWSADFEFDIRLSLIRVYRVIGVLK